MSSLDDYIKLSKMLSNLYFAASDDDSGKKIAKQIVERDKKYTQLLESYTKITRVRFVFKEIHKWVFF